MSRSALDRCESQVERLQQQIWNSHEIVNDLRESAISFRTQVHDERMKLVVGASSGSFS